MRRNFFFKFIYLFWAGGGAERKGERESQAHSALLGFSLMNREIMTWAEIESQMFNRLSHAGTPRNFWDHVDILFLIIPASCRYSILWWFLSENIFYCDVYKTVIFLFFLREWMGESGRGGEREFYTECGAWCGVMTWARTKSWILNWLSHPGAPKTDFSNYIILSVLTNHSTLKKRFPFISIDICIE